MTSLDQTTGPAAHAVDEPDPRRWLALAIIAVAQLMIVLDATIVNIALPSAQRSLHISTADRQWVVTAYTLTFGGLLLLGGRVADYAGRKRMFVIGLLGFAAASALGGLAQDAAMLFAARALQGAFAALMAPAALSLLAVTFTEPRERATAFGVYGAIAGGGAALGLIAGGVLTQYATWRWCLLVNAPIGALTAFAALDIVHESRVKVRSSYDIPGALTATLGLLSLVYGFTQAAVRGWTSTDTLSFTGIGLALLVAFVAIELRTDHPLLPMRVLLDANRGGSFLSSFLTGVGLFGMFLFLTYYLQLTLHYSALKTGFAFLPFSGGIIVSAGLASKFLPRTGPRLLMLIGFIGSTLGIAWLTQIGVHTSFATHVLPAEIVMSLGLGFAFVSLSSTALVGIESRDAGVASALLNTTQQVGGSLGTALLNTIYTSAVASYLVTHGTAAGAAAAVHGDRVAFTYGAGALVLAVLAVALLVRAKRDQIPNPEAELVTVAA